MLFKSVFQRAAKSGQISVIAHIAPVRPLQRIDGANLPGQRIDASQVRDHRFLIGNSHIHPLYTKKVHAP